jgi:hypothetical protein
LSKKALSKLAKKEDKNNKKAAAAGAPAAEGEKAKKQGVNGK